MRSQVNYPAAQITRAASTPQLSTSASVVATIPRTADGNKAAFVRIAVSAGAAYVTPGLDTSATAVTGGTIVAASEALWLNTLSYGAVAFLQCPPGGVAFASISPCEEGALRVPGGSSGLG